MTAHAFPASASPAPPEHASAFARHFAQLVWLLREEPSDISGQKTSLRALVAHVHHGAISLGVSAGHLTANGVPVPDLSDCVHTLLTQLAAHGFDVIDVDERTPPKELLDVARHLASTAQDDGASDLFDTGPVRLIRRDPSAAMAAAPSFPGLSLVSDDEAVPSLPSTPVPLAARLSGAAHATIARAAHDVGHYAGSMFEHFTAKSGDTSAQIRQLLGQLAQSEEKHLQSALARLSMHVEDAVGSGEIGLACEILHEIARREQRVTHDEVRRAFTLTMRRLARGRLAHAVASRLPDATPDDRALLLAVLGGAGEEGADAVIEHLVEATDRGHRRAYFDALTHLKAGVSSLVHMLGDAQWFVVRNAAELLGRMNAREAEDALCAVLEHDDERVRGSATLALMQLGTPRGRAAVVDALQDPASTVRGYAARAMAAGDPQQMAPLLIQALEREQDEEVRAACLSTLGRLATAEAAAQLIAYAQPRRGLLKRNGPSVRLAAIQGLGYVPLASTRDALHALVEDTVPEVRDAARASLAAHAETQRKQRTVARR
jgi:HEAT repeat protein